MTKAERIIEYLTDNGWVVDHEATTQFYHPEGTVVMMQRRHGIDYCRVYHGKSVSKHYYQLTSVLRKVGVSEPLSKANM